ncbi:hypothetical protein Pint_01998 [Pistacia integerrima]|uniref:Uncharacterized protein n=1 Tax=Pistacia integerrima TaxID=434235 RepID=A0ACC0ZHX6_9ROSI|nr:hypothetical protein Pint_01998 [Pistacia integerrima]
MLTVNTVLSVLAVDYPANKVACYVSDDGCSPIILYSLVAASKFAKLWEPFCKKYNVQVRAPFRYFLNESKPSISNSRDFQKEWQNMKEEYEQLCRSIENAAHQPFPIGLTGELAIFSNTEVRDHSAIVKTRVSGLMTNAPFMLNLDCDMFVNNTQIIRHAMCLMLGSKNERDCGFVQSPQFFYDRPEDLLLLHEYVGKGIVGIQGPFYGGTGCFHRRKVIYGLWPDEVENQGKSYDYELLKEYGNSKEFITSAAHALKGNTDYFTSNLSKSLEAAHQVASCSYEYGTGWGKKSLAYLWLLVWGLRSIFELCYAILPAYCILTDSNFLPKVQEPGIYFSIAPFVIYNLYTLSEFIRTGFPVYSWWVGQRMARVVTVTAWLFGVKNVILKLIGLSEMVFEITKKGQSTSSDGGDEDEDKFVFDESPVFVSVTTVVLVHLTALATGLLGSRPLSVKQGSGLGEFFCSVFVLVVFWPFVEGLFRKGKYGIPLSTIFKSAALALFFVYWCRF